jgi:hypothetical protein
MKEDIRCRKGGFAIIAIAGCDVECSLISVSCNHSGSTDDIVAWQKVDLYEAVEIEKSFHSNIISLARKQL